MQFTDLSFELLVIHVKLLFPVVQIIVRFLLHRRHNHVEFGGDHLKSWNVDNGNDEWKMEMNSKTWNNFPMMQIIHAIFREFYTKQNDSIGLKNYFLFFAKMEEKWNDLNFWRDRIS